MLFFFGSDKSLRSHFVHLSVRPCGTKEQSESNQSNKIRFIGSEPLNTVSFYLKNEVLFVSNHLKLGKWMMIYNIKYFVSVCKCKYLHILKFKELQKSKMKVDLRSIWFNPAICFSYSVTFLGTWNLDFES